MKALSIFLVILTLVLVGCSKESGKSSKRLVPATGAAVIASPDFKLEHTTKSGIKCYVRPLTLEVGRAITPNNQDHPFLQGDEEEGFYLLVPIRGDKIMDGEAAEMNPADSVEIMTFTVNKSKAAKTPK